MIKKMLTVFFALLVLALPLCAMAYDDDDSYVSTPNISVSTTTGSATFTLKSDTKNAKIYYTTNGTDPTTSSKKYTSSVKVTSSCEVRAVAYEDGEYSPVGFYTVTVTKARAATPVLKSTNVEGGKKITMTSSGATIYYTLDGSTPTIYDKKYTSSGVTVSESCIIKAIAVRSGYSNSAVATGIVDIPQVGKPSVSISTTNGKTVYKLSGPYTNCTYYYTTDGSTPVAKASGSCKKYTTSGISITKACTVKLIACRVGYAPSQVYSFEVAGPQVSEITGSKTAVAGGYKVTLKTATTGATIYYTINGGTPTTSDYKYTSSGILIDSPGTTYIRAIAVKSGYTDSKVYGPASVTVTQLPNPSASLVTSSSTSTSRKIKLTGPTGSSIYYTTNGTDPTTSSKKVATGGTITITSDCNLRIMAAKNGYANSDVVSYNLRFANKVAAPTVSETKYTDYNKVVLKCSTSGATIYYTLDGSNPLYYGTAVSSGTTIKVEKSCALKAVAVKSGYEDSDVITYKVVLKSDNVTVLGLGGSDEDLYTVEGSSGDELAEGLILVNGNPGEETYSPDLPDNETGLDVTLIPSSSKIAEEEYIDLT